MTWFASEIITTGAPATLATIRSSALFNDHAFHVTNPIRHNWNRPEIIHSVPADGLVFIRPICDPVGHEAEWHGDDILSWEWFLHAPDADVLLTPEVIANRHAEFEVALFPAIEVLRVTKKLSVDTQSPVAFYYCFCWGGEVEVEYAWLFEERERVLIRESKNVPRNVNRLLEINPDAEIEHDDDVLVRTLRSLKCDLPTPYFAPHTSRFAWDQYRL